MWAKMWLFPTCKDGDSQRYMGHPTSWCTPRRLGQVGLGDLNWLWDHYHVRVNCTHFPPLTLMVTSELGLQANHWIYSCRWIIAGSSNDISSIVIRFMEWMNSWDSVQYAAQALKWGFFRCSELTLTQGEELGESRIILGANLLLFPVLGESAEGSPVKPPYRCLRIPSQRGQALQSRSRSLFCKVTRQSLGIAQEPEGNWWGHLQGGAMLVQIVYSKCHLENKKVIPMYPNRLKQRLAPRWPKWAVRTWMEGWIRLHLHIVHAQVSYYGVTLPEGLYIGNGEENLTANITTYSGNLVGPAERTR